MTDFSDRPLLTVPIAGLRSFGVDGLGRLTGPVQSQYAWKPGENCADCTPHPFSASMLALRPLSGRAEHRVAMVDCHCGFYAYFDEGANPHHSRWNVLGIIEGYGAVTCGTRGFRASKARIVGLIDSRPTPATLLRRLRWSAWWLLLWFIYDAALGVIELCQRAWTLGPLMLGLAALVGAFLVVGVRANERTLIRKGHTRSVVPSRVRKNYPDVPIYHSVEEALAAHPLVKPEVPSPDSDPDFWTRSAS